jgi:arsenate reductase (thioredoxin)
VTEPSGRRDRALILCTHNSARSQMAERFLRELGRGRFEVASAGTVATAVHPLATRVMEEIGLDLRGHSSKTLDRYLGERWDYVITVCDQAGERCPLFPGSAQRIHWSFEDPSAAIGSEGERLATFRRVRDAIRDRLRAWLVEIAPGPAA